MSGLLILLIVIGLGLYGWKEYCQIKTGVIPQKTPPAVIEALAKLLEQSAAAGTFLDLSAGFGRRVLALSKRLSSWEITGVEPCHTDWIVANLATIGKNFGNYRFFLDDPMKWPLTNYDVIFVHQRPATLKKWEASIARRLQPGTLLICYKNPLPRIKPLDRLSTEAYTFYLYKKPDIVDVAAPALPINTPTPSQAIDPNPALPPEINQPVVYTGAPEPADQPLDVKDEETANQPSLPLNPSA